ncbi:ribosomal L7Ae/L30e/S12e/Gadd45 family protein [uncultured Veillonella sp.]|jgi:large subunit ribosomal protein L7A|uniref:ribosomal L7Ae/L30e/S12e/Gadd45 family protein n=1 Tax=uncultured Veillonella sp. TaxID=159268 RepID=UPI002585B77D|nr:ribosomal L7Ae/L30e/S12e/Gadd45 family protein [uncultured Veillonella sp.]
MELSILTSSAKTIGAKQTSKAIARDEVEVVFVANNSDDRIALPILELCEVHGVAVDRNHSMEELGKAANIKVKAAAVGVLK